MKLFSYLYNLTIRWSKHKNAPYFLAGVSFAESSFFPVPPDFMLISMGLAKPEKSWRYAFITTLFSVIGGILGYIIGVFAFELIHHVLIQAGYMSAYNQVVGWFNQYGIWIIFLAGFSPIPYKIFTIAAGALSMSFIPFLLASIVGRGMRFYLVSLILHRYGAALHQNLRKYIDGIGWSILFIFGMVFLIGHFWH